MNETNIYIPDIVDELVIKEIDRIKDELSDLEEDRKELEDRLDELEKFHTDYMGCDK